MTHKDFVRFIKNDDDRYFKNMTEPDLYARGASNHEDLFDRVMNSPFRQFSKQYITKLMAEYIPAINKFIEQEIGAVNLLWVLCNTDDSNENGLPHTRSSTIFIKDGMSISTLMHERIHIVQRHYPELFEKYLTNIGTVVDVGCGPLQRSNPDALQKRKLATNIAGRSVVLCEIYNGRTPKSISDVRGDTQDPYEIIAYDLTRKFMLHYK